MVALVAAMEEDYQDAANALLAVILGILAPLFDLGVMTPVGIGFALLFALPTLLMVVAVRRVVRVAGRFQDPESLRELLSVDVRAAGMWFVGQIDAQAPQPTMGEIFEDYQAGMEQFSKIIMRNFEKFQQERLRIRKELGLFANLRPATVIPALAEASTLRPEVVEGVDLLGELTAELEAATLRALGAVYHDFDVTFFGGRLRRPTLELTNTSDRLGQWNGARRALQLGAADRRRARGPGRWPRPETSR